MANVKSKVNTSKNQSTNSNGRGKVGRPKKSLINLNNINDAPIQVMKKTRKTKLVNEQVKNNDLQPETNTSDGYINEKLINKIKSNRDIRVPKKRFRLSNGPIKHKNKHDLKLYDNILKSELLIDESSDIKETEENTSLNNNNTILTDQNKEENTAAPILSIDDLLNNAIKSKKSTRKKNNKQNKCTKIKRKYLKKDQLFECDYCKRQCNSKSAVSRHIYSHSEFKLLSRHQQDKCTKIKRKHSKKDQVFECDYCRRQFNSKASVRRHIYAHSDFKLFPCRQCTKSFRKQLYLSAHIKRQHPNWGKHYMCTMCDKPFLLKENLKIHLLSHTKADTMFKCIYCKERYIDQQELIKHEKEHLIDGKYLCIICESSFDFRNRLTQHYKTHLRVKDYICQHCGKEFLRINSMRRHVQICHAGVRIQCPICKKFLKGHLTEHMRTHEKDRPHVCADCGQRFTQSTQLNVHRRSHTGARPYPCRICNRPFTHSNALMLHIRRHTGEKPFVCAMCPISFSQLPHMKAHMRNIHGKMNPYKCQKCKQFFKLKVDLENHVKGCTVGDKELSFEEKLQASVQIEEIEVECVMSLSRMRFLLALLLTMIATKEKLKYLGFNKRLIDDLLVESLEAMGHVPCKDESLPPLQRLKANIEILLNGTVPKEKMENFKKENKTTEELLELLTNEKK